MQQSDIWVSTLLKPELIWLLSRPILMFQKEKHPPEKFRRALKSIHSKSRGIRRLTPEPLAKPQQADLR